MRCPIRPMCDQQRMRVWLIIMDPIYSHLLMVPYEMRAGLSEKAERWCVGSSSSIALVAQEEGTRRTYVGWWGRGVLLRRCCSASACSFRVIRRLSSAQSPVPHMRAFGHSPIGIAS